MVQCGKVCGWGLPQASRLCSEASPDSWATRACMQTVRILTVRLLDTSEIGLIAPYDS
jgi:hypothetical protein